MVKQNQHSPFYKFTFSNSVQEYTIGIKEAALNLEAESKSLGNHNNSVFEEMVAISDNEHIAYARLSTQNIENLPDKISLRINSLATGQINVGTYLPSGEASFTPGDYSFGIAVGDSQYTFNLTVHQGDTNIQIQRNLVSSINENHIGVRANIRNNRVEGSSALILRSDAVGLPEENDLIFQFDETYLENDITLTLGIDHVESAPSNAEFYINDTLHTSISNRISLNNSLDIDLLSVSEEPVNIYLVADEKKISDKLEDFLASYNQLIDIAKSESGQKNASRLFRDITSITKRNQAALRNAGLTINEDGYLKKTEDADSGQIRSLFDENLSAFRKDIKRTTEKITLNPLDYIDKTIVTYPNTSGTYPNPYHPSKYSGLLFNDYA